MLARTDHSSGHIVADKCEQIYKDLFQQVNDAGISPLIWSQN